MTVSACLLALSGCRSGNPLTARYYNEGNSHFGRAEFDQSIGKYLEAVHAGATDGELFYNLATAYFQSGNLGQSILWYLRAKQVMPRDRDLMDNLEKARNARKDSFPAAKGNRLGSWWGQSLDRVTTREALSIEMAAFVLLIGLLLVMNLFPGRLMGRGATSSTLLVCVLFVCTVIVAGAKVRSDTHHEMAVVTAHETQGRNGPGEEFPVAFTVHVGTEVTILRKRGSWEQVQLPNGWTGWIRADGVEAV
ncbi:MAG: hypothetical protein HY318_19620 [Armatimonadetes bacterium]|nr:hypothetical protein [Armatimonadota bacterium]